MAIAYTMIDEGTADADAASALTGGRCKALRAFTPDRVAAQVGVDAHVITELAHELGDKKHKPALVVGGGPPRPRRTDSSTGSPFTRSTLSSCQ